MPIRVDDPRPPYVQLADDLREGIKAGRYGPGERLPSTRRLAEEHGVAPMTVQSAMKVLLDEGIVVSQQRRGVYVRPTANEAEQSPRATETQEAPKTLDEALVLLAEMGQRLDRVEAELATRPPVREASPEPSPGPKAQPDMGADP